jgi:catechol 2,3-dioxygenase-like lactoylglutathione lyase family enzyme
MKLEIVVIPVSDVDRAKRFYQGMGWREDVDIAGPQGYRAVHLTPTGSNASILIGNKGVTSVEPGSIAGLVLAVDDIDAARAELISHGVDVSEVFHDAGGSLGGGFIAVQEARAPGHDPERRSYASYASFSDPDGNRWLLQEITTRLPRRIDSNATTFTSASGLASALRRAAAAHGEHEKRTGQHDAGWPDWYAAYIAAEQSGAPLPS